MDISKSLLNAIDGGTKTVPYGKYVEAPDKYISDNYRRAKSCYKTVLEYSKKILPSKSWSIKIDNDIEEDLGYYSIVFIKNNKTVVILLIEYYNEESGDNYQAFTVDVGAYKKNVKINTIKKYEDLKKYLEREDGSMKESKNNPTDMILEWIEKVNEAHSIMGGAQVSQGTIFELLNDAFRKSNDRNAREYTCQKLVALKKKGLDKFSATIDLKHDAMGVTVKSEVIIKIDWKQHGNAFEMLMILDNVVINGKRVNI